MKGNAWKTAWVLLALLGSGVLTQVSAQTPFRPVAIVNDSAITAYDLGQRSRILEVLGLNAASREELRDRALDMLVEDRLKLRAGRQLGIEADDAMREDGIASLARRAQIEPDTFIAAMQASDISRMALDDMAAAEIVWQQVVRLRFQNQVEPSEDEIDTFLGIGDGNAAVEYRVREIGLPIGENGRDADATRAFAEDLRGEILNGRSFDSVARASSRSPSAADGGDVGWVSSARLPLALREALESLDVGAISQPLEVPGGFSLVQLIDTRTLPTTISTDPAARQAARQRLVAESTGRLAEGFLQELRRDALIEVR